MEWILSIREGGYNDLPASVGQPVTVDQGLVFEVVLERVQAGDQQVAVDFGLSHGLAVRGI